jgi:hypothetical protein
VLGAAGRWAARARAGGALAGAGRRVLRLLRRRAAHHGRLRSAAGLDDVGHDDGDVVRPAAAQGQLDQPVDGGLRVLDRQRLVQGVAAAHRPGQAVGAQQVAVAAARLAHRQVELDAAAAVQRAGDQRPLRVAARLVLADPPLLDQLGDQRVVGGDLAELAVAQQVAARVADVDQPQPLAGEQHRGERRAHAVQAGVAGDHVAQVLVRRGRRLPQGVEQVGAGVVVVQRCQGGDRDGAGDLPGRVAAHAVGDGQHARAGVDAVLVALPQEADVGAGGEAQIQAHARAPGERTLTHADFARSATERRVRSFVTEHRADAALTGAARGRSCRSGSAGPAAPASAG